MTIPPNLIGKSPLKHIQPFVSAIAPSIYVLLLARFIVGIAVGAISVAAPLYIAEISPASKRGFLVCFFQLAITCAKLG